MKHPKLFFMEGDSGGGSSGGSSDGGAGTGGGSGEGGFGDGAAGAAAGGDGDGDWRTQISDESLRTEPALRDIPDITTLAKNHLELQAHLGNSIRIPSAEAGEKDKSEFYQKLIDKVPGVMVKPNLDDATIMDTVFTQLGRPAEATEYQIPEIDNQGVNLDSAATEGFRAIAHKHGLSQRQFEGIVKDVTGANIQHALKQRDTLNEDLKTLHDEWGQAYDERTKAAQITAERIGAPANVIDALKNNRADAATIKMFYGLSSSLRGEGSGASGDPSGGSAVLTPAEAKMRISEIMNNSEHPYWKTSDPGHKAALETMLGLQKLANPGIE